MVKFLNVAKKSDLLQILLQKLGDWKSPVSVDISILYGLSYNFVAITKYWMQQPLTIEIT